MHLMQRTLDDLKVNKLTDEDKEVVAAELPSPMIPGNRCVLCLLAQGGVRRHGALRVPPARMLASLPHTNAQCLMRALHAWVHTMQGECEQQVLHWEPVCWGGYQE